jgi:YD repeat-containing protein
VDARNQLVAVNVGTHRSEFNYDGERRPVRVIEKEPQKKTLCFPCVSSVASWRCFVCGGGRRHFPRPACKSANSPDGSPQNHTASGVFVL